MNIHCVEHSVSIDVDNDRTEATNPVTATHAHAAEMWYTESELTELSRSKLIALWQSWKTFNHKGSKLPKPILATHLVE